MAICTCWYSDKHVCTVLDRVYCQHFVFLLTYLSAYLLNATYCKQGSCTVGLIHS